MPTTKKRTLLFCLIAFAAIVFTGFVPNSLSDAFLRKYGDMMEWRSSWLAGPHSVNCGRVRMGEDPEAANSCGIEAFAARRPFRIRYEIMWDAPLSVALVGSADGQLYELSFTGNPSGGIRTSFFGQTVEVQLCPEQQISFWFRPRRLSCLVPQQLGPRFARIIQNLSNE